mmetsp:Transcript_7470/g.17177  ORF Transcript_7470/g.17177 Transcript_7470/m.17177 type:complete len:242 (+) Transcript_7470:540-1265(+)
MHAVCEAHHEILRFSLHRPSKERIPQRQPNPQLISDALRGARESRGQQLCDPGSVHPPPHGLHVDQFRCHHADHALGHRGCLHRHDPRPSNHPERLLGPGAELDAHEVDRVEDHLHRKVVGCPVEEPRDDRDRRIEKHVVLELVEGHIQEHRHHARGPSKRGRGQNRPPEAGAHGGRRRLPLRDEHQQRHARHQQRLPPSRYRPHLLSPRCTTTTPTLHFRQRQIPAELTLLSVWPQQSGW